MRLQFEHHLKPYEVLDAVLYDHDRQGDANQRENLGTYVAHFVIACVHHLAESHGRHKAEAAHDQQDGNSLTLVVRVVGVATDTTEQRMPIGEMIQVVPAPISSPITFASHEIVLLLSPRRSTSEGWRVHVRRWVTLRGIFCGGSGLLSSGRLHITCGIGSHGQKCWHAHCNNVAFA